MPIAPIIRTTEADGAEEVSPAGMHLRKIMQADSDGPDHARCSTGERANVWEANRGVG